VRVDVTVTDPMVGRLLDGRYLIERRIARGGMATVYEARDTRLQRPVAVKVMHAALAEDAEFVRRFQREARSAAKLSHPNVVAMFDQGFDQTEGAEAVYLTMEYVPGRTLRQHLRDVGRLSPIDALELLDPILRALSAAHQAGLVHRDVKPENVLISDSGEVKVADFGVARAVSGSTVSTATQGLLIGTVSYLAPEQLTNGVADARADVYSSGILLYEMLTGQKPHDGETPIQVAYLHVNADVPAPSEVVSDIPRFVDGLVLRTTARNPDVRPADAQVFLHQLRRAHTALLQGVDDQELAEDLLAFRRMPDPEFEVEQTVVAPLTPIYVDEETGTAPVQTALRQPSTMLAERQRQRGSGGGAPGGPLGNIRNPRGLAVLALVLAIVLLGGAGAWWLGIARYTHVPPLLETDPAQLEQLAASTGLHFEVAGREFSESIAKGLVMRSDPEQSDRILKGDTVRVWLSKGPERYKVPDLRGLGEEDARRLLTNNQLKDGTITREYSSSVPKDRVIGTVPEAGKLLRRDTRVSLVVSNGPEPVEIPSVVGQDVSAARPALINLGLKVTVNEEFHDTAPKGQVTAQDPPAGQGHRGDTVTLTVSKGPQFTQVPSVLSWNVTDAENKLRELGFQVETVRSNVYVGLNAVVTQAPGGNTMAPTGSVIKLEIV
jgi:eukaryotic-like serine/threonine-protein kinase